MLFDFFDLAGLSALAARLWRLLGKMTPKKWKFRKTLAWRALSWLKPRLLSHRALESVAWFGLWTLGSKKVHRDYVIRNLLYIDATRILVPLSTPNKQASERTPMKRHEETEK